MTCGSIQKTKVHDHPPPLSPKAHRKAPPLRAPPDKDVAGVRIRMEEALLEDHHAEGFRQGCQQLAAEDLRSSVDPLGG